MNFKYFKHANKFANWLEEPTTCDFCEAEKRCIDASTFYGEDELAAICADCLKTGKLRDVDAFTCEGDIEELQKQLKALHPTLSEAELQKLSIEKTDELERTTPKITAWQDWFWPCAGGEYCSFIGYGSKAMYHDLDPDGDGEEFFKNSMYHTVEDLSDVDELWEESLPEDAIESLEETTEMDTLFYVFRSQDGKRIFTVWDVA